MQKYDPLNSPDPQEWLDLDEQERIELVRKFHRKARIKLPNERLHATIHVIVENQIAMGDEIPVRRVIDRLRTEGLDRHDAIHAVGSVLAGRIYETMQLESAAGDELNTGYFQELEELNAEEWLRSFE